MKKVTLLAILLAVASFVGAQNTTAFGVVPYWTLDTFEGWPSSFLKTGNITWGQAIHSYYTNNTVTKTQVASIDATAATVNDGTAASGQTLKLTVPETVLSAGTKKLYLRIAANIVNPVDSISLPATGETYVAVFNVKTDAVGSQTALLDKQDSKTPISSTWTKQVVECTKSGSNIVPIQPLSIGADYTLWIDNLVIKYKPNPVTTSVATDITSTSFTANWTAVGNTTSYKVYLYTTPDGGTTWTTPAAQSVTATINSCAFTGLTPNTVYGYRVTATDGDVTTGFNSVYQSVTTALETEDRSLAVTSKVIVRNGRVVVTTLAGQAIEVYNCLGQKEAGVISVEGQNILSAKTTGVHIVKIGKQTHKVIL